MEKYINDWGKPCYKGATEDTPLNPDDFHMPDNQPEDGKSYALHTNLGSLTVLFRVTGFTGIDGYPLKDVETGFRDTDGKFWLASGNCDVRKSGCKTLGEAIAWVKSGANSCKPEYDA